MNHSRDCPSLWGADLECDCSRAYIAKLEKIASAAKSLLAEDGAKEALSHYVVLQILADAIAELEAH